MALHHGGVTGILHRRAVPTHRVVLAALVVFACAASWVVSTQLFPNFSVNNDEPVYVFQARMLLDQRLTLPVTEESRFFRPWMSGVIDDEIVMVFPPVLPAILALGQLLTGSMRTPLMLLAGSTVLLVYLLARELTSNRWTGVVAAGLMTICPMFVIQSGMFLGYVLAMNLELAAAFLLLRAVRARSTPWFVAAGVVLGLLFFARPFDALLGGTALLIGTAIALRSEPRFLLTRLGVVFLGGLPFVAASLAYNHRLSGNPLELPLAAIGGDDRPGFGWRHLAAGSPDVNYHFARAVEATAVNVVELARWVPGSVLLFVLAGVGFVRYRDRAQAWALAAFVALFPLGYLFYWGNLLIVRGRKTIGPHYYLGVLIPLVVFGAVGLTALARRSRPAAVVATLLAVVSAGAFLVNPVRLNQKFTAIHNRERAVVDEAQLSNAVVFLPSEKPDGAWLLHPRPSFMNDPALKQSVLFAVDHAGDNFQLVDRYPNRRFYHQISRHLPGDVISRPSPILRKIEPRSARRFQVRVRAENPGDLPLVTMYATDGKRSVRHVVHRSGRRGSTHEATWTVTANGPELQGATEPPFERTLTAPLGAGHLMFGATFSEISDSESSPAAERRFWYRARPVDGEVDLMLPGELWRRVTLSDRTFWLDTDPGPELTVEVTGLEPAVARVGPG